MKAFYEELIDFFPESRPQGSGQSGRQASQDDRSGGHRGGNTDRRPRRKPDDPWGDVWRIAGSLGIDPRPLTLRQLLWMAEGRNENLWQIASALMALVTNCHRDPKRRAFTPDDFNPMVSRTQRADVIRVTPENVGDLREAFEGLK